jgi:tripartite-type tricarboxylate transporter receptor subunit TctC
MTRMLSQCALIFATCLPIAAMAAWPDQPIRLIVPYSAGGTVDSTARIVAQKLTAQIKQSVVVVNKPGASGVIADGYVLQSQPDGYTVLIDASAFSVNAALHKLPFDPLKDFIPVSQVTSTPLVLVVGTNSAYHSLADFIAAARKAPKHMTFATPGVGTAPHLGMELLDDQAKIELTHVPYSGGPPALNAVISGQVDAYPSLASSAIPYVQAGKLRALATSSRKRLVALPNVPTLDESGVPGLYMVEWSGFFLPRGTPPAVVQKLAQELQSAIADPEVQERMKKMGMEPVGNSPSAFAAFVASESTRWQGVVKSHDIKVE